MNLYIESLEGGNYLASTGMGASRTLVRDNKSQPKTFHCLNEIREHFDPQAFEKVWLRQSTPYEEMVGQTDHPGALELEIEWYRLAGVLASKNNSFQCSMHHLARFLRTTNVT